MVTCKNRSVVSVLIKGDGNMAPLLAALVSWGMPLIAGAVKAKGKELIEEKLGITLAPDMTPEQIQTARDKELEHEKWLIEAAQKDFATEIADRTDARKMQVAALAQEDLLSKRYIYNLATGLLLFTGVYVFWITFLTIPQANQRFADTILGFLLGTVVSTVVYFFFGTSRSSKIKDTTINNLIK